MYQKDIVILGAGMVGVCSALHLQARGCAVTLVDRKTPGQETSYGNAGIIQREAVEPYHFPRDIQKILAVALGQGIDIRYEAKSLPVLMPRLAQYWWWSRSERHMEVSRGYSSIIAHCLREHELLAQAAHALDLIKRDGFFHVFRENKSFDEGCERAQRLLSTYGVQSQALTPAQFAKLEPAVHQVSGAVHWTQAWCCSDPGELVARYAQLFVQRGGRLLHGDAQTLVSHGARWQVNTEQGVVQAEAAVITLGPWSTQLTEALGYKIPMFVKRGYHQHYTGGADLQRPVLDADRGYVIAPMRQGIRLTTGAELKPVDAEPSPVQIEGASAAAREIFNLGQALPQEPWLGARPCIVDMNPVISPAPHHPGLWLNFGHGHQGFTLGPISGRVLAEQIMGEPTCVDMKPFDVLRF